MFRTTAQWLGGELARRALAMGLPVGLPWSYRVERAKRQLFHLAPINDEILYVPLLGAAFYRRFEQSTVPAFLGLTAPGMTVIDVGANVGYYTLLASRAVGPAGHVHAFEPVTFTRQLLHKNIRRHWLRNVTVHPFAAGPDSRSRTFYSTDDSGNDGFAIGPYSLNPTAITVEQRRVDDLVPGRVDVIKIDIQGSELDALAGMTRVFEQNRAIAAVVEWGPAWMKAAGAEPMDLPKFFRDRGFQEIVAIDDFASQTVSIEAMVETFQAQPKHYCNIIARRE